MNRKAFVLLSGGLDSTTALGLAIEAFNGNVEAISIDYGQRHIKETVRAKEICEHYGIQHTILNLRGLMNGDGVMLTDSSVDVPDISYDEIVGVSPTYVPFRNGTMISAITAHAQKYVMQQIEEEKSKQINDGFSPESASVMATAVAKDLCAIYVGVHGEDALNWAYPDCTPEFVGAMANAIYIGTYFSVRLIAPFTHASKADIVSVGTKLNVPYELTWSCYKGEEYHCGTCPTCRSRKQAFADAGVIDPTHYDIKQSDFPDDGVPF